MEDENDFLSWNSYLKDFFPVGILLIGCKKAGLKHVEDCLKERLPIFVFDKTGGSASIISKIIKQYEDENKNKNIILEKRMIIVVFHVILFIGKFYR